MGALPVVPEFVDHLKEEVYQEIELIAFVLLTPWCITNRGSTRTSELRISRYAHRLETHR